jgi:hypothetical protein
MTGTIVDREGFRKISHASRRVLTKNAEPQAIILIAGSSTIIETTYKLAKTLR